MFGNLGIPQTIIPWILTKNRALKVKFIKKKSLSNFSFWGIHFLSSFILFHQKKRLFAGSLWELIFDFSCLTTHSRNSIYSNPFNEIKSIFQRKCYMLGDFVQDKRACLHNALIFIHPFPASSIERWRVTHLEPANNVYVSHDDWCMSIFLHISFWKLEHIQRLVKSMWKNAQLLRVSYMNFVCPFWFILS